MKQLYVADATLTSIKSTLDLYLEDIFKLPILTTLFLLFLAAGTLSTYGATFVVTKVADTNDGICDADCSLREAIAAANSAATDDVIEFDPSVFNVARVITLGGSELSINSSGSLVVNGTGSNQLSISGNNASRVFFVNVNATVSINSLKITQGNVGFGSGGGLRNDGTLLLNNLEISGNSTGDIGGGLFNNAATLTVINSVLSGNSVVNCGGGIYNFRGTVTFSNSTISGNSAFAGAGICTSNGVFNLNYSTVSNNAARNGAGIFNDGTMNIIYSIISNNSATMITSGGNGGGIYNFEVLNVDNSVISGNSADDNGGGITTPSSSITVTNSTITANSARNRGGGIYHENVGTVSLVSSTIAKNTSDSDSNGTGGGGGVRGGFPGPVNARNCIIADNIDNSGIAPDVSGTLTSQGYNLILKTTGATIVGLTTGNVLGQDPQLLPLRYNGGTTQTIALQPTSPAVDAGDPTNFPSVDQRGISRPQDGDLNGSSMPDIGAYERELSYFTVTKTADTNDNTCNADCSLREALAATNTATSPDNVIVFDPAIFNTSQTISPGFGDFRINSNGTLVINGPGPNLLTLNGNNITRIFTLESSPTVVINGVSVINGNGRGVSIILGGGGIYNQNGILTVKNSVISNNIATGNNSGCSGGGIYNGGRLTLINSTVNGNSSYVTGGGNGGGIYNDVNSSFTVIGSTISNNTAEQMEGGGVYSRNGVTTTITNSNISNNRSWGGGGIYNLSGALNIAGSTFTNNTLLPGFSAANGGAILNNAGMVFVSNSNFNGNAAAGGGAIANSGTTNITNTTFSGNSAFNGTGGAIANTGTLILTDLIISGNSAAATTNFEGARGGGISGGGTTTANRVTIQNNSANSGGGVYLKTGNHSFINSTISGHSVSGQGAGIYCEAATVGLTNSTISNNTTTNVGGGIYNFGSSNLTLTNTTVNNNRADLAGGVFNQFLATTNARNAIIADNTNVTTSSNTAPDYFGTLGSLGYNLIENLSNTTITGITTGNILGQDPQLMTLRSNGGPTNTIALQPTSPAIDAGDPNNFPATDQRGVARPQDGDLNGNARSDIGAYERQVFTSTVTKIADTNDGVCDGDCSLREAIAITNAATTPDNAIVFDPTVFSQPQIITLTLGELRVNGNRTLVIYGGGANMLTISGSNQSRVLYVSPLALLMINGATITGGNGVGTVNSGLGGGIYNSQGILIVSSSNVIGNTANSGGGIYSGENNNRGTLRVISSTISTNNGGGVVVTGDKSEFINSIVSGNSREASGAGIYAFGVSTLSFIDSKATNNSGGGLHIDSSVTAAISGSNISSNTGGSGFYNAGNLTIQRSLISANSTPGRGGGVFNELGGSVTMTNTTVSGNFANIHGGGIFNYFFSSVTIGNSTIVNNTASFIGGGVFNSTDAPVNVRNTIIANNSAVIQSPDFERVLTSQGYNLLKNTTGTTITGITTGNILGQDPLLDPILKMNGGPTATHALRVGSPAIDKGSATNPTTTTDQRGLLRPYDSPTIPNTPGGNGSDIGAFERQAYDVSGLPIFDFDGDGKTDVGIFRPSVGEWWYQRSSNGQVAALQFGLGTDKMVPGDFTGDGKADIAFWRPSDGNWFVLRSEDSTFFAFPFGSNGDIPAPADYDGDGRTDPAVFRPTTTTWFISNSGGSGTSIVNFGISTDKPVVADYDGDAKADIAIWRAGPGEWWGLRSTNGSVFAVQFGTTSDRPVQGDYTGDGKADIAFWRPSTGSWFIQRSEDNSFFSFPFGSSGDIPVPGDYDGDGRQDAAVWRPSSATWFLNRSTAGVAIQQFGLTSDTPIPSAFVP